MAVPSGEERDEPMRAPLRSGVPGNGSALPQPRGDVQFRACLPEGSLLRILDYWRHRRGDGRWPGRADLDPVDIPDLLPDVVLLDVVGEPPRFRKRLVGSAIVAREGRDSTGDWLEETINPAVRQEVLRQHVEAAGEPEGNCYRVEFLGVDRRLYSYQRLLLPLSGDGRRVDMLFGGARFLPSEAPDRLFPPTPGPLS